MGELYDVVSGLIESLSDVLPALRHIKSKLPHRLPLRSILLPIISLYQTALHPCLPILLRTPLALLLPPLPMISNPSPKLLQWNSRGLTRAKLEEFRYHLNCLNPLFVFLSETHWYDSTNISFRAFNLSKRNRPDG